MEIDLSNAEKSDQLTCSADDQDLFGHARSYRCSFCKRGFSSAQALGGHMNIHRKDRARLKEFAGLENNILSLDSTKMVAPNFQPPPSVDGHDTVLQLELARDERSCSTPIRNSTLPDQEIDHDHNGDQLQLSMFTETSSSNNDKVESTSVNRHVKRRLKFSNCESHKELDLELRLGPEPHQASKKG